MSPSWTIRRSGGGLPVENKTPAAWGVRADSLRLTFATRAVDALSFTLDAAFDSPESFPWGCTIELLRDGARVFHGRVTSMPREGSGASESVAVEASGPWWYLEHLVYEQLWKVPDTSEGHAPGALVERPLTRVIIGRNLGAEKITAGAFITEVFDFLASRIPSAPIALGSLHADLFFEVPTEEARDITCAEALLRVLRWFPDIEPRWDLVAATPTLHFDKRGASRLALDPATVPLEAVSLKARPDLRPSCVLIRYQRANELAGDAGVEIIEDKHPPNADEYALDALRMVVELEGASGLIQTQYIKTGLIATADPDWWKRHLPALKSDKVANLTVVPDSNTVIKDEDAEEGASLYAAEIIDGALPWWKTYRETPAIASAKLTYTVTLESGATEQRTDLARIRIRSTDAETGTYHYAGDYRAPEPVPVGLAQRYFSALSSLVHEGSVTHAPGEWDGVARTGFLIDLPGLPGRPDWASLGAPVVSHEVELSSGRSRYTLGPAKHLAPDDWVSIARPARGIAHATRPMGTTRSTGRYAPAAGSTSSGGGDSGSPAAASGAPRATPSVLPLTSAASAPSTSTPAAFEVYTLPKSPAPASGNRSDLFVRLGRVNGAIARVSGDAAPRRWLESCALDTALVPKSGSRYIAGAWTYVALRIANKVSSDIFLPANTEASIIVSEFIPDDSDEAEYLPLAAVRGTALDANGAYTLEVVPINSGDRFHRLRLPMECVTLAHPASPRGVINMKRGRVTKLVADMVAASGFNDASSYGGARQFSFFCRALKIPTFSAGTYSLWFALEYPKTGARLSAADYGTLKLTPTLAMPSPCPWIVVAEKNKNAEAARDSNADGAVKTARPQSGSDGSGAAGGEGTTPAAAQSALAGAFTAQPGDDDQTTYEDTSSTGTENGLPYTLTLRAYTRTVTRAGELVFSRSVTSLWALSYAMPSVWGAEQKSCIGGPGANPGQVKLSASSSQTQDPSSTWLNAQPNGATYTRTVWGSGLSTNGTSINNFANTYGIVSGGVRSGTNLRLLLMTQTVVFTKQGGSWNPTSNTTAPSTLYTYGGKDFSGGGEFTADTGGSDPEGDNPGRDPNGAAEDAPNNDTPTDLGALDKNGAKVTQPGPGIWVWEVARIYPDGRVEQRHVGDILFSPAPQVQLRENAKIAALP